jgi:hypothetical protein
MAVGASLVAARAEQQSPDDVQDKTPAIAARTARS